jgi:(R,R)-butanediol dehydrogenase / meso-butanediol dehydrogenase / diacetyl reductase
MKAAVYHGPGDIRIDSVADPEGARGGEVVIEVARAAICGTDSSEWAHGPLLARPPVVLGHEFAGRVVDVGPDADGFAVGDRVVSGAGISCGVCEWCRGGRTNLCAEYRTIGLHVDGGLAEYVRSPGFVCRRVPEGVSDEGAALAQPLAVALHAVRRSGLQAGQACAVIGVGGIGAFVVAAALARGASPLIALDVDDARLETARSLGAHVALNVRERSLSEVILEHTGGDGAHVVIEASGTAGGPAAALAAARRGGRVLLVGLQAAPRELDLFSFTLREVDLVTTLAHVCDVDLPDSLALLASSDIASTVIDRVIALDDLVDAGIRPLAEGSAKGKIVVAPR